MTSFTRQWNAAYEALPPNSQDARQGAARIREAKVDLRERMQVDHSWAGDASDGEHKKVTFAGLTADPATLVGRGQFYAKLVGTNIELFYKNNAGTISQVTFTAGAAQDVIQPGTLLAFANTVTPTGYLFCNGAAVSRTTYAGLFASVGTLWGVGDSVTTFNLPDLRGRVLVNQGQGTGLSNRVVTQQFGTETHALVSTELPEHFHTIAFDATAAGPGGLAYQGSSVQTGAGNTGPNAGLQGAAHNNVQPSIVVNWCIKT